MLVSCCCMAQESVKSYFEKLPIVWDTTYYFWNHANASLTSRYTDTAYIIRITLRSENEPDTNWRNDYAFVYGMRYNGTEYCADTLCSYWIAQIMMRTNREYLLQLKLNAIAAIRALESPNRKETWADIYEFRRVTPAMKHFQDSLWYRLSNDLPVDTKSFDSAFRKQKIMKWKQ